MKVDATVANRQVKLVIKGRISYSDLRLHPVHELVAALVRRLVDCWLK